MTEASLKVEGGKMVKMELNIEEEEVKSVKITGDFFLEPPEKLDELEKKIEGVSPETSAEEVVDKLEGVEADPIGFSHEDVGEVFRRAMRGD